jgi:tetratricopeptide (TPR) repeat protein
LGAKKKFTNLSLSQKETLFEIICSKRNSKTLLHHYGIIKHGLKKYKEAESLLEKALSLRTSYPSNQGRGESNRNIMVSLGTLYSDWAMDSFDTGKNENAGNYLKLAETNFESARFSGSPNAYPYHAQANMYFLLSQRIENKEEKLQIYGKALSVISLAEANLDKEDLAPIYDLKSRMYRNLGDTENALKLARKLMSEFRDPSGFIGYILYQSDKYIKEKDPKLQQGIAYHILDVLSEATSLKPGDEGILRLNARMTIMLYPLDSEKKMNELKKWYDIATKYDLDLMFQLSVLLFEAYNFEESMKIFDILAKMSQGLAKRFVAREYFKDRNGEKQVFEGVISNIADEYNAEINIDSNKTSIYFRPIAAPFSPNVGDLVKFYILFSYRGPRADVIGRI